MGGCSGIRHAIWLLGAIGVALTASSSGVAAVPKKAAPEVKAAAQKVPAKTLSCDDSLKIGFKPDPHTEVLQVKRVKKGDPFPNPTMDQTVYPKVPAKFGADMCWVKLLVGPGNPGPAGAPSTSRGIGIEVWLPEKSAWNHRFHAIGGSGSQGSEELTLDKISDWTGAIDTRSAPRVAAEEGAVTATTDSGKGNDRSFSFLMSPDGSVNSHGLEDWTYRALYQQAVTTKALIKAYYGQAPKHSYFDGASGGGWQSFRVAQQLPTQYDGIVVGVAALNWNETLANQYPGIVILNDLGGKKLSAGQLDLVSNAAIAACDLVGGKHLGFVIDNKSCRYDPTKDQLVLCVEDGGKNENANCVSRIQAVAINKFWYGPTRDGTVPDPAVDNGWDSTPGGNRLWFGQPRGTDLKPWAQISGQLGADTVAVVTGDPSIAPPGFNNAKGNGRDGWKAWNYTQFAEAFDKLNAAQPKLHISATNPDLSAFKAHGGKILNNTHVNDLPLLSQGATYYYDRVVAKMGGIDNVRPFFKMYISPGLQHGSWNGTSNPAAHPPAPARGQMYDLLVNWVEKGVEPRNIVVSTATREESTMDQFAGLTWSEQTLPMCAYPAQVTFVSGDITKASSYTCK